MRRHYPGRKCTPGVSPHLPLRLIFRQMPPNVIHVRYTYASYICAHLTKNHLTKSGAARFREYMEHERRKRSDEKSKGSGRDKNDSPWLL
ncbi:hypothetical protein D3Z50_06935 [Clostridiaceae bacterium]|nr:hypothetical protein [Clostridiaceae bacterium]